MAKYREITIPATHPLRAQVQDYVNWCRYTKGLSEVTIRCKIHVYNRLYDDTGITSLEQLTNGILNDWIKSNKERILQRKAAIDNGWSGAVWCNHMIKDVKCLVDYHRELEVYNIPIKFSLVKKAPERPAAQTFCTRKEIEQTIRYAEKADKQVGLMIRIAFDTGMRASELMRLRISNFQEQQLRFRTKGGFERSSYITKETLRYLRRYLIEYDITDYLWPGKGDHDHIAYNTLRYKIEAPFRELGYSSFHPHSIRHSCVADLEERGASVDEIFTFIGHRSLRSTQHYLHRISESKRILEVHKKYGKI